MRMNTHMQSHAANTIRYTTPCSAEGVPTDALMGRDPRPSSC